MKTRYSKVCSVHVYSLTPSPLRVRDRAYMHGFSANERVQEPRLICTVAEQVREADSKRSVEMATAIGRIVNSTIQVSGSPLRHCGISRFF